MKKILLSTIAITPFINPHKVELDFYLGGDFRGYYTFPDGDNE